MPRLCGLALCVTAVNVFCVQELASASEGRFSQSLKQRAQEQQKKLLQSQAAEAALESGRPQRSGRSNRIAMRYLSRQIETLDAGKRCVVVCW